MASNWPIPPTSSVLQYLLENAVAQDAVLDEIKQQNAALQTQVSALLKQVEDLHTYFLSPVSGQVVVTKQEGTDS